MCFGMYLRSHHRSTRSPLRLRPRHPWRSVFSPVELDRAWAQQTFGHARLRDVRHTRRLVSIATSAAIKPAALLTVMFAHDDRGRETAYDFFENPAVDAAVIARAHHVASALRCRGQSVVFLAVGERVWKRAARKKKHHHARSVADKETVNWHEVIDDAHDVLAENAPGVTLWPQLDREGDSWSLLVEAVANASTRYTTVRARANRNLVRDPDSADETEPGGKLLDALARAHVEATYELEVPAGPSRAARTARMTLRWVEVTLLVRDRRSDAAHHAAVFALLAEEEATTKKGEKPIRWLLLTTYPIESVRDACVVLYGYSLRWRVELLYAALKDRGCRLEDSELQTTGALERFAAVMFAVGVRLIRLSYLGRRQPDRPARDELTAHEIAALGLYADIDDGDLEQLTIGDAVYLLGKMGGHVGNPDKRPIGFKVLGRGLAELRPLVRLVARDHPRLGKVRSRSSQR